jgi:hypothetical protein
MEESVASINISEKTAVSIFRVRIKNVTPCILPNDSEDSDVCKKNG